jgi:hypothetical protein
MAHIQTMLSIVVKMDQWEELSQSLKDEIVSGGGGGGGGGSGARKTK